jgi:hypothetical protein
MTQYFERDMGFKRKWDQSKRNFQTVLRAAGETEITQENIQDWKKETLDFSLTEEEIAADIFIYLHRHYQYY